MSVSTFDWLEEITAQALADVQQGQDQTLQQEALAWLWVCCPDLVEELELPAPELASNEWEPRRTLEHYVHSNRRSGAVAGTSASLSHACNGAGIGEIGA